MDIVLTIRVIKSFPYRNIKNVILRLDPNKTTIPELHEKIRDQILKIPTLQSPIGQPFKYDSLKVYYQAQGTKTQHLVINLEDDDSQIIWGPGVKRQIDYELTLRQLLDLDILRIQNETELSIFSWTEYQEFRTHPESVVW